MSHSKRRRKPRTNAHYKEKYKAHHKICEMRKLKRSIKAKRRKEYWRELGVKKNGKKVAA